MSSLAQLQCYQVARQLNLLHDTTTLHTASQANDDDVEVPVAGTLLSWLYRDALPRDTQHTLQAAQGILGQWLSAHVTHSELAEDDVARDVFMVSEQILSFLTVSDLSAVIMTTQKAPLLIEAEAPALPASTAHHEEQQPQADAEGTLNTPNEEAEAIGPATHAVQPNEEEEAARQLLRRPMFYLYPTIGAPSTSATHSQQHATQSFMNDASVVHRIFVRMAHTTMLNEESLNPYFGRYGQVSCTLQRRLRLSDLCSHDLTNNNNSDEAHEESSSGSKPHTRSHAHSSSNSGNSSSSSMAIMLFAELYHCLPQELWLQDFVIVVDSYENALRALERAHYKELLFIALHDPALNNYSLAELDTLLAEWPTSTVAIRLGEESTTTTMMRRTAAAVQRRQRKRARQQEQQHGDTNDKRARTEADMSSSSSSSDEEDDDTDVQSGHTASRAASPPAAENESGVATGGTSDTDFVPDLVIDGFPYWMTEDQLRAIVQEHGTVRALHMSIDDHSGAFTGAVMLRMSSIAEAIALSEAMDKLVYKGCTLRCGVLTPELAMTDIMTGEVRVEGPPLPEGFDVTLNECLYV